MDRLQNIGLSCPIGSDNDIHPFIEVNPAVLVRTDAANMEGA